MASIVIAGDTSGAVTIAAPATAGTPTLTLPTTSGTLVVTGGAQTIEFAAGSAASPSITFTGDTNTGIFSPAADTIAFTEGGVESMRIDSSGNVGIGTSSPAARFHVNSGAIDEVARFEGTGSPYISLHDSGVRQFYLELGPAINLFGETTKAMAFGTAGAERMRILSTGQVLVGTSGQDGGNRLMSSNGANGWPATSGTTQTNGCLRLRGGDNAVLDFGVNSVNTWIQATDLSALNNLYWLFLQPNGGEVIVAGKTDNGAYNLQCNGTGVWGAGAYVNGSDERIKDNIAPLDSGLDVVTKLNPVTYKYKEDWSKDQSTQTGFIAQELLTALEGKNYVDGVVQQGGENQYMSVAYQNIIPILTKAIQEQQAMIEELKDRINVLEGAK